MAIVSRIAGSLIFIIPLTAALAGCNSDKASPGDVGDGSAAGHSAVAGSTASGHAADSGHSGAGSGAAVGGHSAAGGKTVVAGHTGSGGAGESGSGAGGKAGAASNAGVGGSGYQGPTVGTAKRFAALAYNSVTTANVSTITGSIGVSAAAISVITGFDDPSFTKYGNDSLAPNDGLTGIAQGDVTKLVGNINPRACDNDLTDVVGGLTGDITLRPGVTCMNSFSADVLLNGHVYLDAAGDPMPSLSSAATRR